MRRVAVNAHKGPSKLRISNKMVNRSFCTASSIRSYVVGVCDTSIFNGARKVLHTLVVGPSSLHDHADAVLVSNRFLANHLVVWIETKHR